jgi:D-threo-aldose 1-dehydrogenase
VGDAFHPGPLAIGTAPLGGLYAPVSTTTAAATLDAAVAAGVTHFDTAPHYGRGLAEERLGALLARTADPDRLTVSTKVGRRVRSTAARRPGDLFVGAPPGESIFDFSPAGVRSVLDESRARLGRERIDVALVHDPDEHLDEALAAVDELRRQRAEGRVGAVGVGTNSAAVVHHLLDRVELDVVLLAGRITLLETSGESVAARCAAAGVTLLAAGVLQSGILADGTPATGDTYDYLPAPPDVRRRVDELRAACAAHGVTLLQAAVAHPRRFPGVTSVLLGVRTPAEVLAAHEALAVELPADLWAVIDEVRSHAEVRP